MRKQTRNPIETWAAWRKDEEARALSSSGGMASVISEEWVKTGGVVYGAAFVKPFGFQHIRCTHKEELKRLRGSKYVQSSMNAVHQQIREDLSEKKQVLFIGTPCQVAGIRNVFAAYDSHLYTIDIICHGTPTLQTLKDSLPKCVFNKDADGMDFRDGNKFQLSLKKNGQLLWSRNLSHDLYLKGFFKAVFYRECCYHCKFACQERIGDLTLGDFWGVDVQSVPTSIEKGVSLVLVNSEKGRELFRSVSEGIHCVQRPIEEAVAGNQQLRHPMPLTWRHDVYKRLYPLFGFKWAAICAMPDIVLKNMFK